MLLATGTGKIILKNFTDLLYLILSNRLLRFFLCHEEFLLSNYLFLVFFPEINIKDFFFWGGTLKKINIKITPCCPRGLPEGELNRLSLESSQLHRKV